MRSREDETPRMRGNSQRRGYVYTPRDPSVVQKRATQQGGAYDSFIDSRFMKFKAADGYNCIRILPPGWEGADHFGYDYWLHSNVGPDNSQYLCLDKMADLAESKGFAGGRCPVCEERRRLEREGEIEEANQLKPSRRVGVWVIDRDSERDGPKFYDMSWTMDKDIASLQINKRTGEAILIDDPEQGFDFEFQKEGKGLNTRYIGKQIARSQTPISDDPKQQDQWLEFISDHPVPDVLNFYEYEYISKVFSGKVAKEDDEDERPARNVERESRAAPRSRASQRSEEATDVPEPLPARTTRQRASTPPPDDEEEEDIEEQEVNNEPEPEEDPVPSSARARLSSLNNRQRRG